jgi:hypothetical protein
MKLGVGKIGSIKKTYYLEEGDDSSDEELEEKIYHTATTAEYYESIDTTMKGVKWHHHHVARLPDNDQNVMDYYIQELSKVCLNSSQKVSHNQKKAKDKVTKILTPIKDSPIGKALQEAYDDNKAKTISTLKDSATKKALNSIIPRQLFADEASEVDLKWSLVCQELGTRILISDKVRELYFLNKRKIGEFNNLPSDEAIESCLKRSIKTTLKGHKKILTYILEHESYTSLLEELLVDKRKVFSLLDKNNSLYPKLEALIQEINNAAQTAQLQGIEEVPGARQIESIIASLGNIEGFEKTYVSTSAQMKQLVESRISQLKYNQRYLAAVEKAYKALKKKQSLATLIERAKENLAAEELEEDAEIGEGLLVDLDTEIIKLKKLVARPTLDDGTSFSYKDITEVEEYPGAEVLFCHTRFIHCSTKR